MNRNPLVPFYLIMTLGIVLIVVFSFVGLDNAQEIASGGGEETAEFIPDEFYQKNCSSCHGQNLEGVSGPGLIGVGDKYSDEEIKDILTNGLDGGMPGGLVPAENQDELIEWLKEQE
ncbi:cytochrome c [Bacillus carboniphilus]|uniref:Cytochrome c n=1 Tax=Bacillus carboniphilus TaxID=86663 RepID=A0ABY9JX37_9BACI|nr:cytochrome c [Bacillus carboniphilus]WLR43972.1 cytochrome c [Bacillus carboniphilus]